MKLLVSLSFAFFIVLSGSVSADIEQCRALFEQKKFSDAIQKCRSASIRGDDESKYYLGLMYLSGSGVNKDEGIALKLIQTSAYASYPEAMSRLAGLFWNGQLVEADPTKACDWWERAAKQNHLIAMEKFGVCHMLGRGREKNLALAHTYLSEAANRGSASATYIVNRYKAIFPSETQALTASE